MGEAIERFFAELPVRAPAVLSGPARGTLQIDLTRENRTEHWFVELAPGSVRVLREQLPADATFTVSTDLFERLVTGRAAGLAALLRNEATFSGSVVLFLLFRRFFPDPPGASDPRETARAHVARPA